MLLKGSKMSNKTKTPVNIEMTFNGTVFIINIVFLETGEIRQKRRSLKWLVDRLFMSETKTWLKNEDIELDVKEFTGIPDFAKLE